MCSHHCFGEWLLKTALLIGSVKIKIIFVCTSYAFRLPIWIGFLHLELLLWTMVHLYLGVVRGPLSWCLRALYLELLAPASACSSLFLKSVDQWVAWQGEDRHSPYRRLHPVLPLEVPSARVWASGPLSVFLDCSLARSKEDFITEAETPGNKPEDACVGCFCPVT